MAALISGRGWEIRVVNCLEGDLRLGDVYSDTPQRADGRGRPAGPTVVVALVERRSWEKMLERVSGSGRGRLKL